MEPRKETRHLDALALVALDYKANCTVTVIDGDHNVTEHISKALFDCNDSTTSPLSPETTSPREASQQRRAAQQNPRSNSMNPTATACAVTGPDDE